MSEVEDVIGMVKVKPDNYYTTDSKKDELSSLLQDDIVIKTIKKHIRPYTEGQKIYIKELFAKEVVFGVGPAGTGKTYLAVAVAVAKLLNHEIDRIILSRPAVEAGEKLGFLPGDMKDKVDPYLQPLYDALHDMLPAEKVNKFIENKVIEIAPLAFMRGRTLSNSYIILDEAQNVTPMQMKMFLTRLGEGSRMVISGDVTQVDLPKGETSGLIDAINRLSRIEAIGMVRFHREDVIRHPLTAKIIEAYA
ncbi:MAG: PhoH family protein [Rickettsiales bacterium]|nr:PhoH family protein [Rickettsiales bacterium]